MNVEQILKNKGYENDEIQGIIHADDNSLDSKTRKHFGLEEEALHLWEDGYVLGDADEDNINEVALKRNYEDAGEFFRMMDNHLSNLAQRVPDHPKKEERFAQHN